MPACPPPKSCPSTGVILEPLPLDRLVAGLPAAIANLGPDHWFSAAHGIMTTDTPPKVHSSKVQIGGKTVTFTGISKGAGMIRPNMATMLSFLATDAGIAQPLLGKLAREIADASFIASRSTATRPPMTPSSSPPPASPASR